MSRSYKKSPVGPVYCFQTRAGRRRATKRMLNRSARRRARRGDLNATNRTVEHWWDSDDLNARFRHFTGAVPPEVWRK